MDTIYFIGKTIGLNTLIGTESYNYEVGFIMNSNNLYGCIKEDLVSLSNLTLASFSLSLSRRVDVTSGGPHGYASNVITNQNL